jgi:hypothetical protein
VSPAVSCPLRDLYQSRYREATRAYEEALDRLDADLSIEEFLTEHRLADQARAVFDLALEELTKHVTAHGCQLQLQQRA